MARLRQVMPRCPSCNAVGQANISKERFDNDYLILYCKSCGVILGIVPDLTLLKPPPPEPESFFEADEIILPDTTPRCPQHDLPLQRMTVPDGYKEAGQEYWVCPKSKECKHYEPVDDPHQGRPDQLLSEPKVISANGRVSVFTDKQQMIELARRAANKKLSAGQIGAMLHGGGYFQHSLVPPLCPAHQVAMELVVIPGGYEEAGRRFWFCPQIDQCGRWDRVRVSENKARK